ncbi:ComEC/Rec2 family competence protein [Chryseobacterium arthrosphaerae]|uniref:ComEC/Rec2 family competence protein n=1 Tax=Chryseobacterium arthrosphaerae TaxID=651561 RepID=UPI00241EE34D|nr:MBL fold metallo-hydrolase [Chryseobacterium arthrosphaerae]
MKIKFLKAGSGDSILIQDEGHNILIDGGNDSKYLLKEIEVIYANNEKIDLLIITHHDDDHIQGIIDVLNIDKFQKNFIKRVIFNSPRKFLDLLPQNSNSRLLSYSQAYDVENILMDLDIPWDITTENTPDFKIGNMDLAILAPKEIDIKKYAEDKDAKLLSNKIKDWNTDLSEILEYLDDFSQDTSSSNRTSIVLLLTHNELKYLFTGDITPNRLKKIIDNLYEIQNNEKPVRFEIIKLPHHGSYRSLNKKILEKISCENFVISTNSNKDNLPNKTTLGKVIKYANRIDKINFYFNYSEALNKLNISKQDMVKYEFNLISNNEEYGYCF